MLVAKSGRGAGELAVLDSPAQSLRYPQMVCRIATTSDACRVGDVFPVPSESICQDPLAMIRAWNRGGHLL
jgi:hypothetical protein